MQGYIRTKSTLFLKIGAHRYRRGDFFKKPDENLTADDLDVVHEGMLQIADGRGFSPDTPLVGFNRRNLMVIADTLHFDVTGFLVGDGIEKVMLRHVVSETMTTLMVVPRQRPATTALGIHVAGATG